MALNAEDRQLVAQIAIQGKQVLRQRPGWDARRRKMFLERKDVIRELALLEEHYRDRNNLAERARFFGMLEFQKMVPRAVDVIRRALYEGETMPDGRVIQPPSQIQLDAAVEVLDRNKIDVEKISDDNALPTKSVTINTINLGDGKDRAGQTVSREKVRNMIEEMLRGNVKSVSPDFVSGKIELKKKKKLVTKDAEFEVKDG